MRATLIGVGTAFGVIAVWAAVTWFWQEPVTGVQHAVQSRALAAQLPAPSDPVANAPAPPERVLPALREGRVVGSLRGPHVKTIVTYGRQQSSIDKGPGLWGPRPGEHGTTVISGHRTTHGAPFRHIDRLHRGDVLRLRTRWGTWRYRVRRKAVVRPEAVWVSEDRGMEQLVLTACHPPYSAAYRYVVFAERM